MGSVTHTKIYEFDEYHSLHQSFICYRLWFDAPTSRSIFLLEIVTLVQLGCMG